MSEKYDVVIIGAGIGGLVCGCYLAKAGLKVLMVEQHDKPGGYCTSFTRKGYRFDAGVHYLGSFRKGILKTVFDELELSSKLQIIRFDPTDKIKLPDHEIYFWSDYERTIDSFLHAFPGQEIGIRKFFNFILQKDFMGVCYKCRNVSFDTVLDSYVNDDKTKAALSVLLSNIGIPAHQFSAISAITLYRDYLLDGGYYPRGGMQAFSDSLAERFKELGGELLLKQEVVSVHLKSQSVDHVCLASGKQLSAAYYVSNIDANKLFGEIMRDRSVKEFGLLSKLEISPAIFAVYLGINKRVGDITNETCNLWNFKTYDINGCLTNLRSIIDTSPLPYTMLNFPTAHDGALSTNKTVIQSFLVVPFETEQFWESKKQELISKVKSNIIELFPAINGALDFSEGATPFTFKRYTSNHLGAAFGWKSILSQTSPTCFPQKTSIKGLYIVGHWCTVGTGQGGIPKVAFSGKRGSELITQELKKALNRK